MPPQKLQRSKQELLQSTLSELWKRAALFIGLVSSNQQNAKSRSGMSMVGLCCGLLTQLCSTPPPAQHGDSFETQPTFRRGSLVLGGAEKTLSQGTVSEPPWRTDVRSLLLSHLSRDVSLKTDHQVNELLLPRAKGWIWIMDANSYKNALSWKWTRGVRALLA